MIPVSNAWIEAHKQTLLPEMFVELTYGVTEPGLQEDSSAVSLGEAEYANTAQVVDGVRHNGEKYATLEHGMWGLDGTFKYLAETPKNSGFVSDVLSDVNGAFDSYPTIIINFGQRHIMSIPGITITWCDTHNEWATAFRVTAYDLGSMVAQTTVSGNTSPLSTVSITLENYNQITIEILGWSHPYHRARCHDIYLGIQKTYSKRDLMSFEHTQTADLLSASLPKNSISFGLRNDDDRWNPDNPTGTEQYLAERQEIKVRYGMNVGDEVEWIKGGTFWVSEWSTPSNGLEASFKARDALEFMNENYVGPLSGNLYDMAETALRQANLPTINGSDRWVLWDGLRELRTDITNVTQEYTIAELLQMIAHAGCCVFYQDRDGYIRIEPWKEVYSGYRIEPFISYQHPEYKISKPLRVVSVAYGDKQKLNLTAGASGAVQTVDNKMLLTEADARRVGNRAVDILSNRKEITGDFRADVRLDVLDNIIVISKYASNIIGLTEVKYSTTGGAFHGKYTGRVVSVALIADDKRSGEFYVGEVW